MVSFCIDARNLKKGLVVNVLISLVVFNVLIALYVYFVLILPNHVPLIHAIIIGISTGILLGYLSLDIVHVFLDSLTLLTSGFSHGLRGFETCG